MNTLEAFRKLRLHWSFCQDYDCDLCPHYYKIRYIIKPLKPTLRELKQ